MRGLDHEDVGALEDVLLGLAHGLPGVGRVHLVGLAVAEARGAVGGVPERTIEGAGVLHRVAHQRRLLEALLVEGGADGADPAVHHVAGGDDVGAGLGVAHRLPGQQLEGGVVEDAVALDDAAVAVVGVLAEADVGDHAHLRDRVLDGADGLLHHPVVVVGLGAPGVLVLGDPEEDHRGDPHVPGGPDVLDRLVDRALGDAGHGLHRVHHALPGDHEHRVHEVGGLRGGSPGPSGGGSRCGGGGGGGRWGTWREHSACARGDQTPPWRARPPRRRPAAPRARRAGRRPVSR